MASPTKVNKQVMPRIEALDLSKTSTRLTVADKPALWKTTGPPAWCKFSHPTLDSLHMSEGDVLVEVYSSGLSITDRDPSYSAHEQTVSGLHFPALEVVGRIRKMGALVKGFSEGQSVVAFDVTQLGLSTFVVVSHERIVRVSSPHSRYLFGLSPMLTAELLMEDYLWNLPTGSRVLVNVSSTGIGAAICQSAQKRGFRVVGITYYDKGPDMAEQFCERVVRVQNLGTTKYKNKLKDSVNGLFDALVMPAILQPDDCDIYQTLLELLVPRKSSKIILLCDRSSVVHAAGYFKLGHELMADLGASLNYFSLNFQGANFSERIKQNIKEIDDFKCDVVQHKDLIESLENLSRSGVFEGLLRAKFVGQRCVILADDEK